MGAFSSWTSPQREETTQKTSVLTFQMPFGRTLALAGMWTC